MDFIGLVTLFRANYGSALQCYATKTYVESLGYNCKILEHISETDIGARFVEKVRKAIKLLVKSIEYPEYCKVYIKQKKGILERKTYLTDQSNEKINLFLESWICPERYTTKELKKLGISNEYIAFIVGSDQVWNTSREIRDVFFLKFTDKSKRIVLAPSFGVSRIPRFYRDDIKKGLRGFHRLSVREEDGEKIIKELVDRNVERLSDPTVLLDRDEWMKLSSHGMHINGDYVFVHFLDIPNENAVDIISYYATLNIKVICFGYWHEVFSCIPQVELLEGDPFDYVSLINNASLVFTDSYHTTLFSLYMETEFVTFERNYFNVHSQNSRILNLLDRCGLQSRYINQKIDKYVIENLPHWDSKRIFEEERTKIKEYIREELQVRRKLRS